MDIKAGMRQLKAAVSKMGKNNLITERLAVILLALKNSQDDVNRGPRLGSSRSVILKSPLVQD